AGLPVPPRLLAAFSTSVPDAPKAATSTTAGFAAGLVAFGLAAAVAPLLLGALPTPPFPPPPPPPIGLRIFSGLGSFLMLPPSFPAANAVLGSVLPAILPGAGTLTPFDVLGSFFFAIFGLSAPPPTFWLLFVRFMTLSAAFLVTLSPLGLVGVRGVVVAPLV